MARNLLRRDLAAKLLTKNEPEMKIFIDIYSMMKGNTKNLSN